MRIQFPDRAFLLLLSLFAASLASAATQFEGVRTNYRTHKPDLEIKVIADRGMVRADVLAEGKVQVSFIQSADRSIVINHPARSYVVQSNEAVTSAMPIWQTTARRQFSMGGYCRVVELKMSAALLQERCLMDAASIVDFGEVQGGTQSIAEFLGVVAQHLDVATLFDRVVAVAPASMAGVPAIVRTYVDGIATSELRLLRTSTAAPARNAFEIPSGFRAATHPMSAQASR